MPLDQVHLDDLGVLRIRGTDATAFLQGQLSNDLARLEHERSILAGLHNPQGRAIAVLHVLRVESHDLIAVLPRELVPAVARRLARYVLRAKVQLSDDSAAWRVIGIVHSAAASEPAAEPPGLAARIASISAPSADSDARWIVATPRSGSTAPDEQRAEPPPGNAPALAGPAAARSSIEARRAWRLLDVAAGLPQVYASTSEQFVAQMLNLDLIDAVSFSKGCYTGQEVIARAHYRGRVKRRMQRWRTLAAATLAPGEAVRLPDGHPLRVIEAATLLDGRAEFLAVGPLRGRGGTAAVTADPGTADSSPPEPGGEERVLEAEPLALPYDLPD